ncbi:MAG: hypothetical protein PHQ94_09010 [Syntrophomonas sp.]|nr:hypothetical protein [Syntrophomonas sp.]
MHSIPWYVAVLISVPQTFLIIKLGFGLFNFKVPFTRCLLISAGIAGICFFLRKSHISFTLNTLILMVVLTILTALVFKIELRYSFISVLLGVMISGIIENIVLPMFLSLTGYSIYDLMTNSWVNIAAFMPVFLVTLLIYWLSWHFRVVLFDFANRGEYGG